MGAVINSKHVLFLFLAIFIGCNSTEQIGKHLSAAELEYLRSIAAAKCVSDTNSEYEDFIASSNTAMLDYDRNAIQWNYTYKYNGTLSRTHKIYVWKVSASAVYFRIVTDETTPKNIYIKYSKTANNDLMRSIQEDDCAQGAYEASASSSTVTLTQNDENFSRQDANVQYKVNRSYSFSSAFPGLFGNLKHTYKKQLYDNDDKPTTATTDLYEITSVTAVDQPSAVYNDNAYYGTQPTRYYCLLTSANPMGSATYRRYTVVPIDLTNPTVATYNLTCDNSSDAPTVTLGTESFVPAAELTF